MNRDYVRVFKSPRLPRSNPTRDNVYMPLATIWYEAIQSIIHICQDVIYLHIALWSRHNSVSRTFVFSVIGPCFKPYSTVGSYVKKISLAAMLVAKRLADVTQEVILREHVTHMPPSSVNMPA